VSKKPSQARNARPKKKKSSAPTAVAAPPEDNASPIPTGGPQFAEPAPTPDPTKFTIQHGSDTNAYKILDSQKGTLRPRPFPVLAGTNEPVISLADAIGPKGAQIVSQIERAGQIVFHSVGDTGNTKGPRDQELVADKMVSDFAEPDPRAVPSFFYHLGDVIYSFGESQYYYDQFYDPYRNYPAPIFAIAGNHDGMVAPNSNAVSLQAFLDNFCTSGQPPHRTPEAGELARTAQIQPGVYFTLEVPFVRILGLYSNCLEDPGVISSQGGEYPYLGDAQLAFLEAALMRIKKEKFAGAVLIATHHPPFVAVTRSDATNAGKHGGSPDMLKEIDAVCEKTGIWPHAHLSGHAHNYQRFTRRLDGRETPFIVSGNGGHAVSSLTRKTDPALRTPLKQPTLSNGSDDLTLENYDDQDFGYMRILVNSQQLRIEYHPEPDGQDAKTPDDSVTVDLATRALVTYVPL